MRDIYEVLRLKEQQSEQLQREIEALRLAIKILDESELTAKPTEARSATPLASLESTFANSGNSPKRFP